MAGKLKIPSLFLMVSLLSGCFYVSGSLQAFSDPDYQFQGQKIAVVPRENQKNDLEWARYKSLVENALRQQSYVVVGRNDTPDSLLFFTYGVDQGTIVDTSYDEPTYSVTHNPQTFGTVDGFGNFHLTTIDTPVYAMTGSRRISQNTVVFQRNLAIEVVDAKTKKQVWKADVVSLGCSSQLSPILEKLIPKIFEDFPGKENPLIKKFRIDADGYGCDDFAQ